MTRLLPLLLLLVAPLANATAFFAAGTAGQGFSPAGNDGNSGLSAALPKTADWCLSNLVANDSCTYASGNYEGFDLRPTVAGDDIDNRILYDCADKHTCSFDRAVIDGAGFIHVRRIKFDSEFHDVTKSDANPRFKIITSPGVLLESIFVRGEQQLCADGTPPAGCPEQADPNRKYNDCIEVDRGSDHFELRSSDTYGEFRIIDCNHSQLQFHDDGDTGDDCSADEVYYWVHGTPDNPGIMSIKYHHGVSMKGPCFVLMEHIEFQRQGNGRGDLTQPDNELVFDQAGGTLHGSDGENYVVRYSTMAYGGNGTSSEINKTVMGFGAFGNNGNEILNYCMAHISVWRAWGHVGQVSILNNVVRVDDIAYLNIASDEGGYLNETEGAGTADSEASGYFFRRGTTKGGQEGNLTDVYIDGIVFNNVSTIGADLFFWETIGNTSYASTDCPLTDEDVECGSNIVYDTGQLFTDPANSDWTILDSSLTANASPIALTTDSGTGSTIAVTDQRAHCFVDDMDGMRASGDVLDINGDECTITAVGASSITCAESFTWASSEEIFYKLGGTIHDDIGAIISGAGGGEPPLPGPGRTMKKHSGVKP